MGQEFTDWGQEGVGSWGSDIAPAGAGGDPFAGAPPDAGSSELIDLGLPPGGADGQLTPWSPGGGFDYTNALNPAGPAGDQSYLAAWLGGLFRGAAAVQPFFGRGG